MKPARLSTATFWILGVEFSTLSSKVQNSADPQVTDDEYLAVLRIAAVRPTLLGA